jgi:hypothetical protein
MRVRKISKSMSLCPSLCPSVRPSVRMEELCSYWRHFHEIWLLLENLQRKFKFHNTRTRIGGT